MFCFLVIDGDLFVAQGITFLLGGSETSASTLSSALYELALHPEIQQGVRAEILQVLSKHDGKLTYEGIQDTSYLDRRVSVRKEERLNNNVRLITLGLIR
jgi:cytochrome P450